MNLNMVGCDSSGGEVKGYKWEVCTKAEKNQGVPECKAMGSVEILSKTCGRGEMFIAVKNTALEFDYYHIVGKGVRLSGTDNGLITCAHVVEEVTGMDVHLSTDLKTWFNQGPVYKTALMPAKTMAVTGTDLAYFPVKLAAFAYCGVKVAKLGSLTNSLRVKIFSYVVPRILTSYGDATVRNSVSVAEGTFAHGCSTDRGDSGSPVYSSTDEVVGIHLGYQDEDGSKFNVAATRGAIALFQLRVKTSGYVGKVLGFLESSYAEKIAWYDCQYDVIPANRAEYRQYERDQNRESWQILLDKQVNDDGNYDYQDGSRFMKLEEVGRRAQKTRECSGHQESSPVEEPKYTPEEVRSLSESAEQALKDKLGFFWATCSLVAYNMMGVDDLQELELMCEDLGETVESFKARLAQEAEMLGVNSEVTTDSEEDLQTEPVKLLATKRRRNRRRGGKNKNNKVSGTVESDSVSPVSMIHNAMKVGTIGSVLLALRACSQVSDTMSSIAAAEGEDLKQHIRPDKAGSFPSEEQFLSWEKIRGDFKPLKDENGIWQFALPPTGSGAVNDSIDAMEAEFLPKKTCLHTEEGIKATADVLPSVSLPLDVPFRQWLTMILADMKGETKMGFLSKVLPSHPKTLDEFRSLDDIDDDFDCLMLNIAERLNNVMVLDGAKLGYNKDLTSCFIKNEVHAARKLDKKLYRVIWNTGILDDIVVDFAHHATNKALIKAYQAGEPTAIATGMGHHDDGIIQTLSQILRLDPERLKGIFQSDVKGFDRSMQEGHMMGDAHVRFELACRGGLPEEYQPIFLSLLKKVAKLSISHFVVVKPRGERAYVRFVDGILPSGYPSTSASGSIIRTWMWQEASVALALERPRSLSLGDDSVVSGRWSEHLGFFLDYFGVVLREARDTTVDEVALTSHVYSVRDRTCFFDNIEKMCVKIMLLPDLKITSDMVRGYAFAVRHTPEAKRALESVLETKNYSGPIDPNEGCYWSLMNTTAQNALG